MAQANPQSIGPTGNFPDGQPFLPGDKGGLRAEIGTYKDRVVVLFGTTLNHLSMTKQQATDFAAKLIEMANTLK